MRKKRFFPVVLLWAFIAALILRPVVVYVQNATTLMKVQVALQDDPVVPGGHSHSLFGHHPLLKKVAKQTPRTKEAVSPTLVRFCTTPEEFKREACFRTSSPPHSFPIILRI